MCELHTGLSGSYHSQLSDLLFGVEMRLLSCNVVKVVCSAGPQWSSVVRDFNFSLSACPPNELNRAVHVVANHVNILVSIVFSHKGL